MCRRLHGGTLCVAGMRSTGGPGVESRTARSNVPLKGLAAVLNEKDEDDGKPEEAVAGTIYGRCGGPRRGWSIPVVGR